MLQIIMLSKFVNARFYFLKTYDEMFVIKTLCHSCTWISWFEMTFSGNAYSERILITMCKRLEKWAINSVGIIPISIQAPQVW